MTVRQLMNQLGNFDPEKEVSFQTLTPFGFDDGTKFGKHVEADVHLDNKYPERVDFRLVYKS